MFYKHSCHLWPQEWRGGPNGYPGLKSEEKNGTGQSDCLNMLFKFLFFRRENLSYSFGFWCPGMQTGWVGDKGATGGG